MSVRYQDRAYNDPHRWNDPSALPSGKARCDACPDTFDRRTSANAAVPAVRRLGGLNHEEVQRQGALVGFCARLPTNLPLASETWIVIHEAPAFVRLEVPRYTGPVWRSPAKHIR
jgi:hypothetical protein